jgi:UDP-N-acetylglucosamine transferase subunit ALG13
VLALRDEPYPPLTEDGIFRVLVTGGSQGASILSEVVPAGLALLPEHFRRRLQVTQQCRGEDIDRVRAVYAALGIPADLATYLPDLPERLAWSHLVIARAGASTIAELTAAGRPAILVPLPSATDDHQSFNAREMAKAGGARMIAQAKFTPVELAKQMQKLGLEPAALAKAAARARKSAGRAPPRTSPTSSSGPAAIPASIRPGCARRCGGRCPRACRRERRHEGRRHRHRHDPFRRHRRHRHVGHRRGDAHPRLQGAGLRRRRRLCRRGLRKLGIPIAIGHRAENLGDAAVVVISTAIKRTIRSCCGL